MATDIVVPQMGESVTEGTVGRWFKQVGDAVAVDEPVCEVETDKATLDIPSPVAGTLGEIVAPEGTDIAPGAVLGRIEAAGAQPAAKPAAKAAAAAPKAAAQPRQDPRIADALTAGFDSLKGEVGYPKSLITYDGKPVGEWQGPRPEGAPGAEPAAPQAAAAPRAAAANAATVDVVVPPLGESIVNCLVARWLKAEGDAVAADETIAEIETEKATLDIAAPAAGTLAEIVVLEGAEAEVGAVIARIATGAGATTRAAAAPAGAPAARKAAAPTTSPTSGRASQPLSPAVRKLVEENGLDAASIPASGPGGRLTKGDVLAFLERRPAAAPAQTAPAAAPRPAAPAARPAAPAPTPAPAATRAPDPRGEERVRMTRLRQTIAHRLKEAQNTAAMLTTFNEVDMSQVLFMRDRFREEFERRHGVRLGLMSFFVKAAVKALKEIPAINAEIQGDEIVYRNYYDVGVAVGGPGGLVVPVLRDADKRDFADIERSIADFGRRAHEGKLTLADLTGGTFTVTNGGVFGSMLSTPILNPPQSGILGMHNIVRRPVAVRGANGGEEIAIRPIMYLALSYDHRIVDGREAVTFLVRIKQAIEAPERLLVGL